MSGIDLDYRLHAWGKHGSHLLQSQMQMYSNPFLLSIVFFTQICIYDHVLVSYSVQQCGQYRLEAIELFGSMKSNGVSFAAIVSELGILKLFTAGLPLRIAMVGTLTGLQW